MTPAEARLFDRLQQQVQTMEEDIDHNLPGTMDKLEHLKHLKQTPL